MNGMTHFVKQCLEIVPMQQVRSAGYLLTAIGSQHDDRELVSSLFAADGRTVRLEPRTEMSVPSWWKRVTGHVVVVYAPRTPDRIMGG